MNSNCNADFKYQCHPRDSHMDRQFTAIDFLPRKLRKSENFIESNIESFRSLVDRANKWLKANPYCKIETCETVKFKNTEDGADITKMTYKELGGDLITNHFIRGLRLWVEQSSKTNHPIDYMNILPQVTDKGGVFRSDTYDTIDAVISRTNDILRTRPLPGRIITVENQEMKMKSVALDPDKTKWNEGGNTLKHFVFLIRIFYEKSNEVCDQQIGVQDFVPNLIKKRGVLSDPKYEPFNRVVAKASDWCSRQYGMKVCNIQTLNIQFDRENIVDTKKMYYQKHWFGSRTYFVRILRANYVQSDLYFKASPLPSITLKTFPPVQLNRVCPNFETLLETKNRVEEWVRVTGVPILNAETGVVRLRAEARGMGDEEAFHENDPHSNKYWIFVIRLYIIGSYEEPPPELLKPVPNITDPSCILL